MKKGERGKKGWQLRKKGTRLLNSGVPGKKKRSRNRGTKKKREKTMDLICQPQEEDLSARKAPLLGGKKGDSSR